jgi:hypothetical protein
MGFLLRVCREKDAVLFAKSVGITALFGFSWKMYEAKFTYTITSLDLIYTMPLCPSGVARASSWTYQISESMTTSGPRDWQD